MRTGPPVADELVGFLPTEETGRPFMAGASGIAALRNAMAEFYEHIDEVGTRTGALIIETVVDDVPVILINPPSARRRGAVFSVHGGGLVAGGHRSALEANARLALALDAVLVVPDYRLAPEHPYPAPLDDVAATWRALADGRLGDDIDLDRLVVMGGSSGGGLAAGLVLRIRADGGRPPRALVLLQPQLDDRNTQPSTFELKDEPFWDRESNRTGWDAYLGGIGDVPAEAAPARETDLSGFPSTFIEIGQVDLFRDEDLDFAARLSRCGVPVEAHLWSGAFHGFDGLTTTRVAQRANAARHQFLEAALAPLA